MRTPVQYDTDVTSAKTRRLSATPSVPIWQSTHLWNSLSPIRYLKQYSTLESAHSLKATRELAKRQQTCAHQLVLNS
jgi:hypothetical protein